MALGIFSNGGTASQSGLKSNIYAAASTRKININKNARLNDGAMRVEPSELLF